MRSRIWAWIVTSSAVVGSSAMSSSGSQASAIAIITRCAMPPDSSCGNASSRRSGSGMPTIRSSSAARSRAARRFMLRCSSSTSPSCMPTFKTGFRLLVGCWKIMLIRLPRSLRISRSRSVSRSRPSKRTEPAVDLAGRGDEAHDRQAGDALPAARLADEAEDLAAVDVEVDAGTARTTPSGVRKLVSRPSTSSRRSPALPPTPASRLGQLAGWSSVQPRVERVAQAVAEQVEAEHGEAQRDARGR